MPYIELMKTLWSTIIILLLLGISFFAGWRLKPVPVPHERIDTLIYRDTIRDSLLIPVNRYITRVDTVSLRIQGDTVMIEVEVPIERKEYKTENYRAVIEGFRPSLVEMEVYRQTHYITRTEIIKVPEKSRWGIGIQIGYGTDFNKSHPYIGIGVQYNILSW